MTGDTAFIMCSRKIFLLLKKYKNYKTTATVVKVSSPVISLAFRAEDVINNSSFKVGVYHAAIIHG